MKKSMIIAAMLLVSVTMNAASYFTAGDVNGDGKVDINDVTILIDKVLGR